MNNNLLDISPIYSLLKIGVYGTFDKDNRNYYVYNNLKNYRIFLQISKYELGDGERNFDKAFEIGLLPFPPVNIGENTFKLSDIPDERRVGINSGDPRYNVDLKKTNIDTDNTLYIASSQVELLGKERNKTSYTSIPVTATDVGMNIDSSDLSLSLYQHIYIGKNLFVCYEISGTTQKLRGYKKIESGSYDLDVYDCYDPDRYNYIIIVPGYSNSKDSEWGRFLNGERHEFLYRLFKTNQWFKNYYHYIWIIAEDKKGNIETQSLSFTQEEGGISRFNNSDIAIGLISLVKPEFSNTGSNNELAVEYSHNGKIAEVKIDKERSINAYSYIPDDAYIEWYVSNQYIDASNQNNFTDIKGQYFTKDYSIQLGVKVPFYLYCRINSHSGKSDWYVCAKYDDTTSTFSIIYFTDTTIDEMFNDLIHYGTHDDRILKGCAYGKKAHSGSDMVAVNISGTTASATVDTGLPIQGSTKAYIYKWDTTQLKYVGSTGDITSYDTHSGDIDIDLDESGLTSGDYIITIYEPKDSQNDAGLYFIFSIPIRINYFYIQNTENTTGTTTITVNIESFIDGSFQLVYKKDFTINKNSNNKIMLNKAFPPGKYLFKIINITSNLRYYDCTYQNEDMFVDKSAKNYFIRVIGGKSVLFENSWPADGGKQWYYINNVSVSYFYKDVVLGDMSEYSDIKHKELLYGTIYFKTLPSTCGVNFYGYSKPSNNCPEE